MKKIACVTGIAFILASLAVPAAARMRSGVDAVDEVLWRIKAADCAGAARRLNEGLANDYPEVMLLAGIMFDNGTCVKADWKKAVHFYVRAYDGGQTKAMLRLASGFAAPEHGPDMAAALWWASRKKMAFPFKECAVGDAVIDDPDRFVAELRSWPQQRLALCNYVVGVFATMSAEIRYPERALYRSVEGDFAVRFTPSVPRIDFKAANSTVCRPLAPGNAAAPAELHPGTGTAALEKVLGQVAERALKRYPQPAGIPADAVDEITFSFALD